MFETGWDSVDAVTFEDQQQREVNVARSRAQNQFYDFIRLFRQGNIFMYRSVLSVMSVH
jgi:hypothetical protein